jgi:hypothetical protein
MEYIRILTSKVGKVVRYSSKLSQRRSVGGRLSTLSTL